MPGFAKKTYGFYIWNQIQSLDEKVNEISDCKESGVEKCANLRSRRGRSCSIFSQASNKIPLDKSYRLPYPVNAGNENHFEGGMDTPQVSSPSCSVNVHDVFEVPQTSELCSANRVLTRRVYRVYVFRYQNRVNSNVNSISGKIRMFDEFDSS